MKTLVRSFGFSSVVTVLALGGVFGFRGASAGLVALVLAAIELAFSFDNAVINAQILGKLSTFWRSLFLTLGIVIAIFGVRALLPILIVSLSARLPLGRVAQLALYQPHEYARHLMLAHPAIAAFGGIFLLMLSLHFFMVEREVQWLRLIEQTLSRFADWWLPLAVSVGVTLALALAVPEHRAAILVAGLAGAFSYAALNGLISLLGKLFAVEGGALRTGWAALATFAYLEILDASLSFDGVIGAFAITTDVVLIAIGLGIGAVWVRSLTVYMVRQRTLEAYKYLEHGAHYAITVLALTMLLSLLVDVPDFLTGVLCLGLIVAAVVTSREVVEERA